MHIQSYKDKNESINLIDVCGMQKKPNGILKLCGCCGEGENCVACSELNYNNIWIYMGAPVKYTAWAMVVLLLLLGLMVICGYCDV